ncbi:putative NAD(P)H nitroreductase mhqN [Corallococcus coralloides DSM 2259]|uniref:Putative NAD(P)H nitroreductase mhqN n=2 Tax=Corallococcus coralloides TaxID=184914 RepID=H8MEY5_CORCM|nr:putative NAD(P)H nitroreductase mhqN [Corallococcus coralloides DSM 2259]
MALPERHPQVLRQLETRKSVTHFQPGRPMPLEDVRALAYYASQAPSSSNLQHWRFLALVDPDQKNLLRGYALGQRKVSDCSAVFVVLADLRAVDEMARLTDAAIRANIFGEDMRETWNRLADNYRDEQVNRDEALRSAALASMNLMTAAHALGYVSGPVGGFNADGVSKAFGIPSHHLVSLIICVGHEGEGNWTKKPRKPVDEILFIDRMRPGSQASLPSRSEQSLGLQRIDGGGQRGMG